MSFFDKLITVIKKTKSTYKYNVNDFMVYNDGVNNSIQNWNISDVVKPTVAEVNAISSPDTTSDFTTCRKLRQNITTLSDGLTQVKSLRPVTFNVISNGQAGVGFIADEIWPALGSYDKNCVMQTFSGNLDERVDNNVFSPFLVRSIQQLSDKIDTLNSQVTAMNTQIATLNSQVAGLTVTVSANSSTLTTVRNLLHIL